MKRVTLTVKGEGEDNFVEFLKKLAGFNNGGSSRSYGVLDPSSDDEKDLKFDLDGDGSDRLEIESVEELPDEEKERVEREFPTGEDEHPESKDREHVRVNDAVERVISGKPVFEDEDVDADSVKVISWEDAKRRVLAGEPVYWDDGHGWQRISAWPDNDEDTMGDTYGVIEGEGAPTDLHAGRKPSFYHSRTPTYTEYDPANPDHKALWELIPKLAAGDFTDPDRQTALKQARQLLRRAGVKGSPTDVQRWTPQHGHDPKRNNEPIGENHEALIAGVLDGRLAESIIEDYGDSLPPESDPVEALTRAFHATKSTYEFIVPDPSEKSVILSEEADEDDSQWSADQMNEFIDSGWLPTGWSCPPEFRPEYQGDGLVQAVLVYAQVP